MDSPQAQALREAALAFAGVSPAGLPGEHVLSNIEALVEIRDLLDGALAAHLHAAQTCEATVAEHGLSTRSWLVAELRRSGGEAGAWMSVANALPARPVLAQALAAGAVSLTQAALVVSCLRRLPDELATAAEGELVTIAAEHSPSVLRRLTGEILTRYSTTAEAAEAAEQARYDSRFLQLSRTFEGWWHITGMLDPLTGEAVHAALAPLLSRTGPDDQRSLAQRRADALAWLARHNLACGGLPDNGGDRPQIVITLPFATLLAAVTTHTGDTDTGDAGGAGLTGTGEGRGLGSLFGVGPATTARLTTARDIDPDGGAGQAVLGLTQTRLPAGQLRELLCDAAIIPAVLGGNSEILDLGRATRTWNTAQRRAARLRDGGCTFPACHHGLDVCDLHHITYWSERGPTNLDNATHLCHFHHQLIHTGRWKLHRDPTTGQITATGPQGQTRRHHTHNTA